MIDPKVLKAIGLSKYMVDKIMRILSSSTYSAELPIVISPDGIISIGQADTNNDGYLTSEDWNTFMGSASWLIAGNNIYNINIGNVGIGGNPSNTHKFEVVGGIKASMNSEFNGVLVGKGANNSVGNICIGPLCMTSGTASGSTLIGYNCGNILSSANNVGVGLSCLGNATAAAGCTAVGWNAMRYRTSGLYNTAIGYAAMGVGIGTGADNVALGKFSLHGLTSGYNNIAIGSNGSGANLLDGFNNILIGNGVQASTTSISNELNIGDWIKGTAGQIGIGGALPNSCAILDIASTTKGLLLPRMTKAERDLIGTPVAGLAVYQTDNTPGLRVYNGTNWMRYTETAD